MHPVRTTKNAVTPRSIKKLSRAGYTIGHPVGAAQNALIGSVLNAGSRPRSSGSRGRPQPTTTTSAPHAGDVFVGAGVRAGEALASADRLASLMAVQRDRFAPAALPQVPNPVEPDRLAMQRTLWQGLGKARPAFWQRRKLREARERVAEQAASDAAGMHAAALACAAADRAHAQMWWASLNAGDEATVTATLTAAFEDNTARVAVLSAAGDHARLFVLLPDVDVLGPKQAHVTSTGRLSSRNWPKADLHDAYASLLGAHLLATARETWAVTPSVRTAKIAGVRRAIPDSKPTQTIARLEVLFDIDIARDDPRWNDDSYSHDILSDHPHGLRRIGKTGTVSPWPTKELPTHTLTDIRRITNTN